MNKFSVVFKEGLCKYLIIYDNIKSLIENGKISEGEKSKICSSIQQLRTSRIMGGPNRIDPHIF